MKKSLSLTLRRVRSSVRTDINTGGTSIPCSIGSCGATNCSAVTNKATESRSQSGASGAKAKAYGASGG